MFDRNPNEVKYVHNKKHWADVIKNSGSSDFLIWKQPEEDFNNNSILIVNPGEKAVFIKDGEIINIFECGKYILSTENYPFISRITNAFYGGISVFNCVVFFVKDTDSKEIKWGTDSPIRIRDKQWGITVEVRARAVYKIHISEPGVFLVRLTGCNINYETSNGLYDYFNGEFTSKIRMAISRYLDSLSTELIGLDSALEEISRMILPYINELLSEYGIICKQFALVGIDVDGSKYNEIDKSQIGKHGMEIEAKGKKEVIGILGEHWKKQQVVDILKASASNTNSIGVIAGLNGTARSNDLLEVLDYNEHDDAFSTTKEKLRSLKEMLENELITEEEFNTIRESLLKKLL